MNRLIDALMSRMDAGSERIARRVAHHSGRRSFLGKMGMAVAGSAMLPILPFDKNFGVAHAEEAGGEDHNDPTNCEYWRYCALDGNLCNDCGGTITSCPPGAEASKVSWVGTCSNPNDGKDYLVSYNDCCGKAACTGNECLTSERERPGYRMGLHNDINWCMANSSQGYHCTVAVVVGMAGGA
ncbi:methylamine dehydrogenase light chain [Marinobacter sp. JSM 1782161]|uniref:methylamine dehydrogenase light chain n=1 Tax=Marinobacter sp. JSM 1782161 TaxID=2685906 RepID=UPI001402A9FB|nr:methylamine dehydrogenase light chain [Marinobacter sp. JSM 1782161]